MGREKFPCARQSRPQNPRYPCSAERENETISRLAGQRKGSGDEIVRTNAAMCCVEMFAHVLILMICYYYRLAEVEYLHLVRCEMEGPSQDCIPVLYSTWNRVRVAKVCVGSGVTICIVVNVDVIPSKNWTVT